MPKLHADMEFELLKDNKKIYLLLILILVTGVAHVAEQLHFYYFNPDSTQSNLRQLKSNMDTVLQQDGIQAAFQPFARFSDFDQQIRQNRPALLYVPYWYFERYGSELGLRPLLHSKRNNKLSYQKKLITNIHSTKNLSPSQTTTLAMTTMGPEGETVLDKLIYKNNANKTKSFSIIEVPKDADAVFAVALGQVDNALVSSAILEQLEKRNPRLTSSIRVIAETLPINLPVLVYLEGSMSHTELDTLRRQLQQNAQQKGKNIPGILGIDAWRPDT